MRDDRGLRTSSDDLRLLNWLMRMINNLRVRLWLNVNHLAAAALMQMPASARHVISSSILRLNNFSRRFDHVNLTNVLHQALNVRQWRLISLCANAVAPQAMIDYRLVVRVQLTEISLNAAIAVGYSVL